MSQATASSKLVCRVAAALLFAIALDAVALAVVLCPPVLERYVLVDGEVGSTLATLAVALASLLVLAAGLVLGWASRWLWARAERIAARQVQLVAMAMALVATIVLVLLELATRIAVPASGYLSGDAFWIQRWIEARAAQAEVSGDSSGFKSDYPMDRFDPELGWVPSEGYRSEQVNVTVRGARGTAEYVSPKPAGTRRIVVVGDSFTFGEGVSDAETYPSQLEAMLEGVEVVNLGVLGYGTDQQLLRLRTSAFGYEPDLVVLGFFGPNADRNVLSFRDAPKPRFALEGGGIVLTNTPVPDPETEWVSPVPLLRGVALLETVSRRIVDRTAFAPKWEITRRILDAIALECEARGVPLLLAFYPDKKLTFMRKPADAEIVVEAWARAQGVRFFSIRPALSKLPQSERAKIFYGHWTPFGNGFVARQLAAEIAQLGLARVDSPVVSAE